MMKDLSIGHDDFTPDTVPGRMEAASLDLVVIVLTGMNVEAAVYFIRKASDSLRVDIQG